MEFNSERCGPRPRRRLSSRRPASRYRTIQPSGTNPHLGGKRPKSEFVLGMRMEVRMPMALPILRNHIRRTHDQAPVLHPFYANKAVRQMLHIF